MTKNQPAATVIIATLNRDAVLCEALDSIFSQSYVPLEVIVVDQSTEHEPETWAYLEANQTRLRYRRLEQVGLPNARNAGIEAASGEIILFCDDDVRLASHWVDYHVENYQNPRVGAVGGRIVERGLPIKPEEVNQGRINLWGRPKGNFTSLHRSNIQTVRGGNMSFRRRVLEEVGGFDTAYAGTATLEETDLCYRILRAGYQILYDPRAELEHRPQPTGNISWRHNRRVEWYRNYLHNGLLFHLKNKPRYELPPFLAAQLLIAAKQGLLIEKSWHRFSYILSGLPAGYRTYQTGHRP